jgi:hypothetical protein
VAVTEAVRLIDQRCYDPPRSVEVGQNGQWWPGFQVAWRLTSDRDYWVADCEYAVAYDWGRGKHLQCVPAERVRLPDAAPASAPSLD